MAPGQERQTAELYWEAYALTGEDELLSLILDLAPHLLARHGRRRQLNDAESSLFALFTSTRSDGASSASTTILEAADDFFVDCGLARAAWISATLSWLAPAEASEWITTADGLDVTIPALCQRVVSRLDPMLTTRAAVSSGRTPPKGAEVRLVTGLFTLSLAAWAATLRLAAAEVRLRSTGALSAFPDALPDDLLELLTRPAEPVATELLQTLESCALVADNLLTSGDGAGGERVSELVIESVARELAVFCRAGVAVVRRILPKLESERLDQITRLINEATGERVEPTQQRVERELYVLHLAWSSLGFGQLAETLALRGAQASTVLEGSSHDWTAPLKLAKEKHGVPSFFAWSCEAGAERTSVENRAVRAYNAVMELVSVSDGRFRLEASLFALAFTNQFSIDQKPLLGYLLQNPDDGVSELLARLPDERVPECAVMLGNSLLSSPKIEGGDVMMQLLEERAAGIQDTDIANRAGASIQAHAVALQLANDQPVSIEAEVDGWPFPREGVSYAYMLGLLFEDAVGDRSHVVAAAIELLERADPIERVSQNFASLAARVARWIKDEGLSEVRKADLSLCLDFIEQAAPRLDDRSPIVVMLEMYTLLVQSDRDKPSYRARREQYQRDKIHRDEIRVIRPYLGAGRYFEVFLYYAQTLMRWGLDWVGDAETKSMLTGSDADKKAAARKWVGLGEQPPRPFVQSGNRTVLNGKFLAIGAALLTAAPNGDEALANARQSFERLAFEGLSRLLATGAELPSVGPLLKSMLERHRAQYAPPPLSVNT